MIMKGIAISTLFLFILAMVSIVLLISFIGVTVSPAIRKGYCDILRGFTGLLPLPEYAKPALPSYCTAATTNYQQVVIIEGDDPDKIASDIAAYSLACWKTTGEINLGQDSSCYELDLKRVSGQVTKENVTAKLDTDYKNKIDWQTGTITAPKAIGIYYNSTSKLIMVI